MDAKEEIKQRLSVEEVVGDYIQLQRAGRNFKALSPFSNEKTASFMVSPEKQIWHDFSSGKGGDIFTFVMEMDGVDFIGAMEILARKANVDLSQYQRGDKTLAKKKERMYEAHELAIKYYHATLAKNKKALEYLIKDRGYTKEIISEFKLGYAPANGSALINFLSKRGFSDKEIAEAGLASTRRGISDMFRGRIVVPLRDGQGRAIGFTGRVLDDGMPKYLNTPQTPIYDKSGHVFGLSFAKQAIREDKFVVAVEGNMDVVAAHMAGTKNVIAVAGTSLTKRHLVQLSRLSDDVRLAFDNDKAGLNATLRAIPLAQDVGVSLSVIAIAEGKDPDDIIKVSKASWKRTITRSKYVVDWLIEELEKQNDISSAQGKKQFSNDVSKLLSRLTDEVEKDHYIKVVADKLNSSVSAVKSKVDKQSDSVKKKKPKTTEEEEPKHISTYEDLLIGLLLRHPDLRESAAKLSAKHFPAKWQQKAFKELANLPHKPVLKTPEVLQDEDTYVKIALFRAEEFYGAWNSSDRMIETIGLTRKLLKDYKNRKREELTQQIAEAEKAKDTRKIERLLKEFNELIKQR